MIAPRFVGPLWLYLGLILSVAWCVPPVCAAILQPTARSKSREIWSPASFPNPQVDLQSCGRNGLRSSICDPDGLIPVVSANKIEGMINAIYSTEHPFTGHIECSGKAIGYQMAVALFSRMESGYSVEKFTRALHDKWGVGRADCQNGLVLLIAVDNRKMYMSTGSGVPLSKNIIERILDKSKPLMRQQRYDKAIESIVHDTGVALANDGADFKGGGLEWITYAIWFCLGLFFLKTFSRRRHANACKNKLKKITEDRDRAQRNVYESTSCPICLDDWVRDSATSSLRCGHKFCESCILSWLNENNDTCPICREAIIMESRPDSSPQSESSRGMSDFLPEMRYRLFSLRRNYPSFVSQTTYYTWINSDLRTEDFASERGFAHAYTSYTSSGSRGTSSSFGGGSSSGGGGGGSSW